MSFVECLFCFILTWACMMLFSQNAFCDSYFVISFRKFPEKVNIVWY